MQTSQESPSPPVVSRSAQCRQLARVLFQFLLASAKISKWRKVKNGIKLIIGRGVFDETGLFWLKCVLHFTGIRSIRVTCTGHWSEGAGSQALWKMDAINFARFYGLEYVHTPFRSSRHTQRPMEEWAAAWEALFNLGAGESPCNDERRDVVDFFYNYAGLRQCFGWRRRFNELADHFRAMIPEIRRKYYLNKSPAKSDQLTVAVHIRRGDVTADEPGPYSLFTCNHAILQTITTVQSVLDARNVPYKMQVHSQGNTAEFADFSRLGAELFLNVDAVWTMEELIKSDILIMAKGGFSYCAGLISSGIKIFEPGFLDPGSCPSWKWRVVAPEENWIACKSDGSFDPNILEHQLGLPIQACLTA